MFIDIHTHVEQFEDLEIPEILHSATANKVDLIITAGTTIESSKRSIDLSKKHPILLAGIGIHPMDINEELPKNFEGILSDLINENKKNVICISEIGLDFLPSSPNQKIQEEVFKIQIGIAKQFKLPIIFHSRNSNKELLNLLKKENTVDLKGAFHYFQGSVKEALEAIDLGYFISVAKPILYNEQVRNVIKQVPVEQMVLETDSFPQPWKKYRSNWTEPKLIPEIAEELAKLKNLKITEIERITTNNAKKMLNL
tara:strand:+ start:2053 stop:2817 length:765 start_codon:yes stop_codon:yes gene_type:complete